MQGSFNFECESTVSSDVTSNGGVNKANQGSSAVKEKQETQRERSVILDVKMHIALSIPGGVFISAIRSKFPDIELRDLFDGNGMVHTRRTTVKLKFSVNLADTTVPNATAGATRDANFRGFPLSPKRCRCVAKGTHGTAHKSAASSEAARFFSPTHPRLLMARRQTGGRWPSPARHRRQRRPGSGHQDGLGLKGSHHTNEGS